MGQSLVVLYGRVGHPFHLFVCLRSGPVGMEGLTSYKYSRTSCTGNGHVVADYGGGGKTLLHEPIAF